MTGVESLAFLPAISLGIALPLAVAHYGRSPADRLETPHLAIVVATPFVVVAAVLRRVSLPPPDATPLGFAYGVAFGVLIGCAGLAVYGVLARLVLPLLEDDEPLA